MSKRSWLFVILLVLCGHISGWAQNYCYILSYYEGYLTSVVSQSKKQDDPTYWLYYGGQNTSKLKYTFIFPKPVTTTKDVKTLSFTPQVAEARIPFSFHAHESEPLPTGQATLKVANDTSTCKYPVEIVDKGFESYGVPRTIPDAGGGFVDSGIVAKGIDLIQHVRVSLYLSHTFVGDLEISLIGPDGTTVMLSNRNGGSLDDFGSGFFHLQRTVFDDAATTSITAGIPPYVGTYSPQQSLSAFNGKYGNAANGLWKIRVQDDAPADVGYVINWALMIDDVPGTQVTWFSTCLTREMFIAAGYTPNATEEAKLINSCYTLHSIITGITDRLVDNNYCTGCHTGYPGQAFPGRYVPDYNQNFVPQATHWETTSVNSTYSWGDPTPAGIIYHFKTNPIGKPAGLKAIFQKWLDDGAHL